MPSAAQVLARLMGRTQRNSVVTKLFTHAIGQPLLVHPGLGEQLIGAYLEGAVDAPDPILDENREGKIAVMNISGALVNRPTPDICGEGPASYAAIRENLNALLGDGNVSAIVFRIDSPGGMASGCFDLTDFIYQARGAKPIVAMVDDMAYSGAYALAAACDEIWVTRTGGVGSVGAVYYHFDYSEQDKKEGVRVTPIFAGKHKIDLSPHKPIDEDTRARAQMAIDGLRALFAQSVATYRKMDVAAIIGTEALCYNGQAGIDAGLADRLGTMHDLIADLSARLAAPKAPAAPAAAPVPAEAQQPPAPPVVEAPAAPAPAVVAAESLQDAVVAAKLPSQIAMALIERAADPEMLAVAKLPVAAQIDSAKTIRDLCVAAKMPDVAAGYIRKGVDVEVVRAQLIDAASAIGPEISTHLPKSDAEQAHQALRSRLNPTTVYRQLNNARK